MQKSAKRVLRFIKHGGHQRILVIVRNFFKYVKLRNSRCYNSDQLVDIHFRAWSQTDHQNREGLRLALEALDNKQAIIIETGTSAHGTDSSRLFDSYVTRFGGTFFSVDINPRPRIMLTFQHSRKSKFIVSDSLKFLDEFRKNSTVEKVDLVYLDSWDVDWSNPIDSAIHGYREYQKIKGLLKPGSILVIDDTPRTLHWIPIEFHKVAQEYKNSNGMYPGKGALIFKELEDNLIAKKIWHEYNLVYKFN